MSNQPVLQTPRLRLRSFQTNDLPHLIELHSDPEVMRHITAGQPSDPAELESEILPRWIRRFQEQGGWGFFAAEEVTTGQFVGWFHLHPLRDEPTTYDLGYRLHRRFWGQGLATEGSQVLLAKLAWSNQARRITARTMCANHASQHVLAKMGLHCDGEYQESHFPGQDQRAFRYSMDWSTIVHRRIWLCHRNLNDRCIARLPSGYLVLFDYQTLPGYCVLLADPVQSDLNSVPDDLRTTFLSDMATAGAAIQKATGADLMNYMILGNTDRALHAHIAPRYSSEVPEHRKTGPWSYYPTYEPNQITFDPSRDSSLIASIRSALSRP